MSSANSKRTASVRPSSRGSGLAAIKRALYASSGNTLEQQLDVERDAQRALGYSADYREGVAAFLDKRAPHFSGR